MSSLNGFNTRAVYSTFTSSSLFFLLFYTLLSAGKNEWRDRSLIGYSAQITKFDERQRKRISTGVTVFSGVDKSGNRAKSDGIYKTKEYKKQEEKYDEAESSK